ncbi:phosphomannomutase [Rhizobium aethiopicum]|uniref:Phosphomannomutase n=1 Tax=Rhizobium aethiopicum TaxID=1138170 RepID=A0A7W6MHZ3_9HYPH|nr:phosphomannomutase [Rhizobium aethiopicum]MBB4193049.1 phosphomannomutase [Rhizobium aethiopicum]MBB4579310.1 phosphomannomutase [Rhizobium aethiopicum]
MSLKFGTSGLRGLAVDLKGKPSLIYSAAFATSLLRNRIAKIGDRVLVGYDFRDSSPAIAANVKSAIGAVGLQPVDCGNLPTPALAFYGIRTGAASMMITGSHIPADRNGIKFYLPDGEIGKTHEQEISAIAQELVDLERVAPAMEIDEAANAALLFMNRNKTLLPEHALSGMRVGVYQHSTVARDMLNEILSYYGADVFVLGRSEVFIPVDTEAVSAQTVATLQKWAAELRLDAIVSADGDGDRPLIADETGTPINGDICGLITARFLGADAIVTPITSNSGIEALGRHVMRTKVGSPFVIAGMQEVLKTHQGVVGFEANGGTLTGSSFPVASGAIDPLPTRDSFLPILAVLATAAANRQALSELKLGLGLPFAAADRLENFATERAAALMAWLRADSANLEQFTAPLGQVCRVSELDGLRVTLTNGRVVHFRPSGNAPEMRCYVEAGSAEETAHVLDVGLELLRNFGTARSVLNEGIGTA